MSGVYSFVDPRLIGPNQVLLENLLALLEIVLLFGQYSVLRNFSGRKDFSKNVTLIVYEGRNRLEVDKNLFRTVLGYIKISLTIRYL